MLRAFHAIRQFFMEFYHLVYQQQFFIINWKSAVLMEKVEIYLFEKEFYNYNLKKFIVLLIQISLQIQLILLCFCQSTWQLTLVNIVNWIYLNYLFCLRFQLKLTCKMGVIKEQILIGIALINNDYTSIYLQLPSFIIFNVLYYNLNWSKFYKKMNSIPEAFLIFCISAELILQIFKQESIFETISSMCEYFLNMYLVFSLIVILIFFKYIFYSAVTKILDKLDQLNNVIVKKDLYQASMIHELRNPLNSVIGGIELLSNSDHLSQEDKRNLQIAQHSAIIMINLIGSILDIAKLEANKMELDQQYVLLRQSLQNIMDLVEFKAKEKKLKLMFHFAHDIPDYVFIDHQRLTQILLNLISNAVKFTSKGYVKVLVYFVPGEIFGSPKQVYMKRNSAPDYMNQELSNDLLQLTSYDSDDFEFQELSKRFKDLSVKRSLLHISQSLFLENNSPFRHRSSLRNSPHDSKQQKENNFVKQDTYNNGNIFQDNNSSNQKILARSFLRGDSSSINNRSLQQPNGIDSNDRDPLSRSLVRNQLMDSGEENKYNSRSNSHNSSQNQEEEQKHASQTMQTVYDDGIEEDFLIDLKTGLIPKEQNLKNKNFQTNPLIQIEEAETINYSQYYRVPVIPNRSEIMMIPRCSSEDHGSKQREDSLLPNTMKDEESKASNNNFQRNNFIFTGNQDQQSIYQGQNSSIMQIHRNEEQKNDDAAIQNAVTTILNISPSNQQDSASFMPQVPQISNTIEIEQEIKEPEMIEQPSFSIPLTPNLRSKSDNRLEQFRQQRQFLRVNTKPVTDFQSKHARNNVKNQKDNPGSSGNDLFNSHSPTPLRTIPSNAPSMISDPFIINEKLQVGYLQIVIQDSGIGINDEEQKKLFTPFQQANKQIQKKFGGTGLGLWISQQLIRLMKGKINLRSVPNVGTTFTLRIPTQGVSFEEFNNDQQKLDTNLSKLNILILIQDELNKEIVRKFLIKLHCNSSFANDYDDFVGKLQYMHRFSVCIVDADQFSISQIETIKQLMKIKKEIELKTKKTLTMVVLTNMDMDVRQRNKYLADRVIMFKKPVKQDTLSYCLQQINSRERSLLPHLILREQHKWKSMRLKKSETLLQYKDVNNINKQQEHNDDSSILNIKLYSVADNHGDDQEQDQDYLKISKNILENSGSIQTPVFEKHRKSRVLDLDKAKIESMKMRHKKDSNNEEIKQQPKSLSGKLSGMNMNFLINVEQLDKNEQNQQNEDEGDEEEEKIGDFNNQLSSKSLRNNLFDSEKQRNMDYTGQKSILIVDDEIINRTLLYETLISFSIVVNNKYKIIQACNGQEAVDYFKQDPSIFLILTDLNMPIVDGFQASQLIRDFEKSQGITEGVCIVGISGEELDYKFKRQNSFNKSGINEFIQKPFRRDMIERLIFDKLQ